MESSEVVMHGLVNLDAALFEIHLQQVVYAEELDAFIRIPFLQTKPGRIVGVPSFG
jgi:hypothetical protein